MGGPGRRRRGPLGEDVTPHWTWIMRSVPAMTLCPDVRRVGNSVPRSWAERDRDRECGPAPEPVSRG